MFEHTYFSTDHHKLAGFFAISDLAFPNLKKTILNALTETKKTDGIYDCIIAFDALSIYKRISRDEMLNLFIHNILPHIEKQSFAAIAYKFHPEHFFTKEGIEEANILRKIIHDAFPAAVELDKSFGIENYMKDYNVALYTYVSSLAYYATLFGCTSYSLSKRLMTISKDIFLPQTVISNMIQI